jgi:excisionase family DNA binding protein
MKKLLTPEEIAENLSVSEKTVKMWLLHGKLRGLKAGIFWRVREEDLEAFLDPTQRVLENAPPDEEPWTPEDEKAVEEAEIAIRKGRIKSFEKVRSRKGKGKA